MADENATVSMDNTKAEILEHLAEQEIEADENLTKARLLALLDEDDEDESEPEAEVAPPAAIVNEQIVTRRGTSVGGTKTMTKSEYDKELGK
jgi:hypothetical protein